MQVSRLIRIVFHAALGAATLGGLFNIVAAVGRAPGRPEITDFHAFYIVGQLVWSGRFADAYQAPTMLALEEALGGQAIFMPWSYPPLFGFLVAALGALPIGLAFLAFSAGTLTLFLWASRRLDAEGRWPVLLASIVSIALNLRCGQNGLLTAGMVAAGCGFLLGKAPARAGLCFAALSIKPHLIPLLPLALIVQRRWLVLGIAAGGAMLLSGLSYLVFGAKVFEAFLVALPNIGRLMAMGAYPLHRMTSVFAFCLSVGLPVPIAMLLHATIAVVILSSVARIARRRPDPRLQLGLALLGSLFVSPYVYDYDLVLFGVGLILISPRLLAVLGWSRYAALLVAYAAAQSLGLVMTLLTPRPEDLPAGAQPDFVFSPMGPALIAVTCCILRPLWIARAQEAATTDGVRTVSNPLAEAKA